MSMLHNFARLVNSPQGRKLMHQAKRMADDPRRRKQLRDAAEKLRVKADKYAKRRY